MGISSGTLVADKAFHSLKMLFSSALVLFQPDASPQFTVDVDALDTGVGAALSQLSKNCIYMYFPHRFTPTECKYDVRNRELLAVKLA